VHAAVADDDDDDGNCMILLYRLLQRVCEVSLNNDRKTAFYFSEFQISVSSHCFNSVLLYGSFCFVSLFRTG